MSKIGKRAILLLLALPIGFNVMAQETKKPTLEELIPGGESYRYAENLYGLQWWGDECIKPGVDTLYSIQPKTGKETMVITREQINKVLEENKAGKLSHLYSVRFPWTDKAQMLFTIAGKFIVYDFKNNQVISTFKPKDGANNEDYCAASGNVAYTIDNNLYVNEKAVTNEPEGIVCGQTVHRNEFGINKGTFWSPKGNLLAFYRMDESMVTQYPLVDITARVGEVNNVRYPMAGMTSHQVKVGIYNPATGKSIYLNAGDPTDRYFTNISWAPDEKSLYLIEVNRDQNHAKLCQYNAETGEPMGVLYEEMHPKYVEPQNPIVFLPWDPTKFIYQSQRDGYNHLYLFETNAANMKGETYNSANGGSYFQAGYTPFGNKNLTKIEKKFNLTFASQIVGPKTDIFTDKGNYLSMAKQKFDINIKNFLWKDYLTKDIQVDDERIASVTLSLSDEAKNYIKLSDTTFPSADSSDGATPVVKKGIVNVSLIVTSTTNIKTTISGTESYILITVKDIWGKTTTAKIAVPIKNKADEDADNAKK